MNEQIIPEHESSLSQVFGPQISLAELSGDTSRQNSVVGLQQLRQRVLLNNARAEQASGGLRTRLGGLVVLIMAGFLYGQLFSRLHDNRAVSRETLTNVAGHHASIFWATQGAILGLTLPFLDKLLSDSSNRKGSGAGRLETQPLRNSIGVSTVLRTLAAFLGVAYGVRNIVWNSSLESGVIWALLNPFLWYLIDGSRHGFAFAALYGVLGSLMFAALYPSNFPRMSLTADYLGVCVWVASAFFCSSICLGSLGRFLVGQTSEPRGQLQEVKSALCPAE